MLINNKIREGYKFGKIFFSSVILVVHDVAAAGNRSCLVPTLNPSVYDRSLIGNMFMRLCNTYIQISDQSRIACSSMSRLPLASYSYHGGAI